MAKRKVQAVVSQEVEMSKIREPKFIARLDFGKEEMQQLIDSIEMYGLIQPIRLKPVRGGYEIVAGHRRYLAHKKLKRTTIRAEIVDAAELEQELVKMHENKVRTELSDIEEAKSFQHLKKISNKTNKQIAKEANVSESYVTQKIGILGYPDFMFNAISTNQLTFSAARELLRIRDLKVLEDYVDHACRSGITPKVAKQWADDWLVMSKANSGEIADAVKEKEGSTPDTIKLPCFACGKYFKPENTSMIRICKNDLDAIRKALKIAVEEDD